MRRHLVELFRAEGDFDIELARNGTEAVKKTQEFEPDVVSLDINMPEMDGLTALSMIMAARPTPVVMVSSLTEKGALATLEALALGAVDFVPKPGGTISLSIEQVGAEIVRKVRAASKSRLRGRRPPPTRKVEPDRARPAESDVAPAAGNASGLVLVGVSTGGPRTLEEILPALPRNFSWPVLVAQHMPANFTAAFASRLGGMCAMRVVEANRPIELEPGTVYIGRGGSDMTVVRRVGKLLVVPKPEDPGHLWHPSVELLVRTALQVVPAQNLIGVMLTGMGYDGAEGMAELRRQGGRTIAESEETAVVFGMPQELIARGGASEIRRCDEVSTVLRRWVK